MRITVIGGGSTYTPELINGFLARSAVLPLDELVLMDIDAQRLELVGGLAQRMVAAQGNPFTVILTTDRQTAIAGADYVLTQLRVGYMDARREDEYLGQRHGLIGQETTGVGGMAKALRTIPVILEIAQEIQALAPQAMLVNFTNPAGLITQALAQYAPNLTAVGVCNVPFNAKMSFLELLRTRRGLDIAPERAQLVTLGLNHLSWHRGLLVDGEDVWDEVLSAYVEALQESESPEWMPKTIEVLRLIPNYYLQYYYHTAHKLAEQAQWPPSRAEAVMAIERELLQRYADPSLTTAPPELTQRGGAYYSTVAAQLLAAHYNNLNEQHVVNVPNRGGVAEWPAEWVLEMPCRVCRDGIIPIPCPPLPPVAAGLLAAVKAYELLTVEAAVHGDRSAAYQALLAHPLGPAEDQIEAVLDDLLQTNKPYLPRFFEA